MSTIELPKYCELSLAPMLKVTTPLFRLLIRKISKKVILFTEMVVSSTVVHVTAEKLKFILGSPEDGTVVQLGGSDPDQVAESVEILLKTGWKHFNLNCGCPSDRVQSGNFGALLMLDKEKVASIVNTVYNKTGIILSLKIRTGVDNNDSFEFLSDFIKFISAQTPCFKFYVHARKCWLCGLNPKQNRNVPPLNYEYVYLLKREFPHLFISLNGGIKENGWELLKNLDGLMIGRHAWDNVTVFETVYGVGNVDMKAVVQEYLRDAKSLCAPKHKALMPLINIRKGLKNSKKFKQVMNEVLQSNINYDEIYDLIAPYLD